MKKNEKKRFKFFYEGTNEEISKKSKPYKRKKSRATLKEYLNTFEENDDYRN